MKTIKIIETGLIEKDQEYFAETRAKRAMEVSLRNNIRSFILEASKFRFHSNGTLIEIANETVPVTN